MMKTMYVALSLSHVKSEAEREEIRSILKWLETDFSVRLLPWAFDTEKWEAKPVANVFLYDRQLVSAADLVLALYLSSDGSDGRGAELVQRAITRMPLIAFAKEGVKVSRFPTDCLEYYGLALQRFKHFKDMGPSITNVLNMLTGNL